MNHKTIRDQMAVNAELMSALRTLLPWAGPVASASDSRMKAIQIGKDALAKAEAVILAGMHREEYGL